MTSTQIDQAQEVPVAAGQEEWAADFFGGLNAMPAEAVDGIAGILEVMGSEPGFLAARRSLFQSLGLQQGSSVLEAGCGTATNLADLLALVGPTGSIRGLDPTDGFIEAARKRSKEVDAVNATYSTGDIRAIPLETGSVDAAFCEKVLIHAGPTRAALSELARIVRPGGRVGAVEWLPYFAISSTRPDLVSRINGMFRQALYDFDVSLNLARHFHDVGLTQVRTQGFLAQTTSLDQHPFWRAFLVLQMPMFVHAGMLAPDEADAFVADIEERDARGEFSCNLIVQTCVGTKSA